MTEMPRVPDDSGILLNARSTAIMILDKDEFLEKATLVHHSGYTRNFDAFVNMLRWSRVPLLKRNGFFMAIWQAHMLRSLVAFQKELRKVEGQRVKCSDPEEKKRLERHILIEKQWIRVLQTIADGIAWRAYSFNRPLLRVMSENSNPGDLTQTGYDYIAVLRGMLMNAPHFRVLNDLTRVLRIGDITVFYPGGKAIIYEAKQKGKKIFDSGAILKEMKKHRVWPNPQKHRHLVAQMAIINKKIDVPVVENGKIVKRLEVDVVDLDFPIANHFSALKRLIRRVDKDIVASELVEEGYYIEVASYEKLTETNLKELKKRTDMTPEWAKRTDGSTIKISNYDSFMDLGMDFPRNIIPYSILPLPAKDCVRLMMGQLHVSIFVDTGVFRRKLVERGWRVVDDDPYKNLSETTAPAKTHMFEMDSDDTMYHVSRDDGDAVYNCNILLTDLLMMASSMYAFDFVLDAAYAMFERGKVKRDTRLVTRNFLGEQRILR